MSFGVPLGPHFPRSEKVGARGGTQLIAYKNRALVTCTSNPCFRSATGVSTCSLVGSSLAPAAGFIGSASAADLYFCFFCNIKYGCWANLVDGLGFAVQVGDRMQISKVDLVNFDISMLLTSDESCLTQKCCIWTHI